MAFRELLIRGFVIEGMLLAGAMVLFFGHALWLWCYQRWSQPQLIRGQAVLLGSLNGPLLRETDLQWLQHLPARLQIRLFASLLTSLTGCDRQHLRELAQTVGLIGRIEKLCQSRLWWRRFRGSQLITVFGGGQQSIGQLLCDRHPLVRAQAAEWAVEHPRSEIIDLLLSMLNDPHPLCRFKAQDSLLCMGRAVIGHLYRYLIAHTGRQAESALRVAAGLANPRFLIPAMNLCLDPSPQVRALAAEVLGTLGGSQAVSELISLLADPDGKVRAAAARAVGKLAHWPATTRLASLLRDPIWEVRREAGLALRSLGGPGVLYLRRCLSDHDRFAADMARQVLELPYRTERTIMA